MQRKYKDNLIVARVAGFIRGSRFFFAGRGLLSKARVINESRGFFRGYFVAVFFRGTFLISLSAFFAGGGVGWGGERNVCTKHRLFSSK